MPADPRRSRSNLDNPVEIVISRQFAAPRELVWRAWTEVKHVGQWWGPAGYTTTTHEMDFRVGGCWRYTMHGADGRDYPCRIDYLEIDRPSRLVYALGGEVVDDRVSFRTEVTFESSSDGQQTLVTMRSIFPSAEARDFVVNNVGAVEGGQQHLANLEDYVGRMTTDSHEAPFRISHVFRAPREQVWRAWTEGEQLLKWFGPKGSVMRHAVIELRVGGTFHFCMSHPQGMELWGRWVFRAIAPPDTLEFVSSFSNAAGEIVPAPFEGLGDFPLEVLTTVTFVDHAGVGRGTLVTVEARPLDGSSRAQRDFFAGFHASLHGGWTGTMLQLAEHLGE